MKVAILTFTDGTNIGQRLQNYALQHTIKNLNNNYDVYTIKQGYPFSTLKRDIKKAIAFLKHPTNELQKVKRQKKFNLFNERYIKFYHEYMPFCGDNTKYSNIFDCFVVGSDQIWHPTSPFVGDNFFLTFARKEQRLTYAPSFSTDTIPENKREQYKKYLNGFSSITVREDKGATIVKEITGRVAEVVLDPTLLLTRKDYDKIKTNSSIRPNGKYILSMFLGGYPEKEVQTVSSVLGIQVLRLDSDAVIGPDEFLDLVENAELVLTDSYHITIFSIIYGTVFVNFSRRGKDSSMNSRFQTLYRLLGIENRTWDYIKTNTKELLNFDYQTVYKNLKIERERCILVLKRELECG